MRQMLNILGLIASLALTLSGGSFILQVPGTDMLVLGAMISIVGLLGVGIFLARILSHIDSRRQFELGHSSRNEEDQTESVTAG